MRKLAIVVVLGRKTAIAARRAIVNSVTERKDCRACHGELEDVFDFGNHQVINFGTREDLVSPLHLVICKSCRLLQLKHTVDPDKLFRTYFYKSGVNQTMRNHLQSIVEDVKKRVELVQGDFVVDIGANDGTLLNFYPNYVRRIGFEPSQLVPETYEGFWMKDYFSAEKYRSADSSAPIFRKAKIITAIAMFYDLDEPGKFLDDVKQVLAPDGLFVIEQNYLPAMLENNRVDNISAEHLCYYSVQTLRSLLDKHGLVIEEIKFDEINGGVFRACIRHAEYPQMRLVAIAEEKYQLDKLETYHKFIRRVQTNMRKLNEFIQKEARNLKVDCYGASTRGLMLMQLAHLDQTNIRQAVERNPAKVGTKYNGIPVVDEQTMRDSPPHYLLILAPDFVSEFYVREKKFLQNGGKFIIPFPTPHILSLESI